MTSPALASLWEQTLGRFLPIAVQNLPFVRRPRIDDDDYDSHPISSGRCPPANPLPSTTDRTEFGMASCTIYGYPSTGGVLIKEAEPLDMLFLSLPRTEIAYRSNNTDEEDAFCRRLIQAGAVLWPSKSSWYDSVHRHGYKIKERRIMVYGWPSDGKGVWVLRYERELDMPQDFGRVRLAMTVDEKVEIMKQYNATYVEDPSQVEELRDGNVPYTNSGYGWEDYRDPVNQDE